MKGLIPGFQFVRTKNRQPQRRPVRNKRALKPVATQVLLQPVSDRPKGTDVSEALVQRGASPGNCQKPLLPFPVRSSLEVLRRRTIQGVRRLEGQAERINQLSAELEAAVFELKAIAAEINSDWKTLQATQNAAPSADICEYRPVAVPQVELKPNGSFVLVSKPIDLFQAEREAMLLAQTLRNRAKKKRGDRQ